MQKGQRSFDKGGIFRVQSFHAGSCSLLTADSANILNYRATGKFKDDGGTWFAATEDPNSQVHTMVAFTALILRGKFRNLTRERGGKCDRIARET